MLDLELQFRWMDKENLGHLKMSIFKSMYIFQIISYLVLVSWISGIAVRVNLYIHF